MRIFILTSGVIMVDIERNDHIRGCLGVYDIGQKMEGNRILDCWNILSEEQTNILHKRSGN